jgi:hypothetical protein
VRQGQCHYRVPQQTARTTSPEGNSGRNTTARRISSRSVSAHMCLRSRMLETCVNTCAMAHECSGGGSTAGVWNVALGEPAVLAPAVAAAAVTALAPGISQSRNPGWSRQGHHMQTQTRTHRHRHTHWATAGHLCTGIRSLRRTGKQVNQGHEPSSPAGLSGCTP